MFNPNGSLATRPSIQSFLTTADACAVITVQMNTDGSHTFALVKASALTHSLNNNQQ
jgi:hypothetical protein